MNKGVCILTGGETVNCDNIARTEETVAHPIGYTLDEAKNAGVVEFMTVIIFNAPSGQYGELRLNLTGKDRKLFLEFWVPQAVADGVYDFTEDKSND